MLKRADADYYDVSELNLKTGAYDAFYTMDYLGKDVIVNAFGMYHDNTDSEAEYLLYGIKRMDQRGFNNQLCTFTSTEDECEAVSVETGKHNVGAIIGNTLYYGAGWAKYAITGLGTGSLEAKATVAKFNPDAGVTGTYGDVTGVVERATDSFVVDGDDTADTFLLGLSKNMYLFVQKIDSAGDYGAYTRLHPDVLEFVWEDGSRTQTAEEHYDHNDDHYKTEETKNTWTAPGWGAAFTFDADVPRVFFTSNKGWGAFELKNVVVPAACFQTERDPTGACDENDYDDVSNIMCLRRIDAYGDFATDTNSGNYIWKSQYVCDQGSATLQWVANSDPTSNNDGMNCPNAFFDL